MSLESYLAGLAPAPLSVLALGVQLSQVAPQEVAWLWPGRVPLGKLTILDGDPGLGKSFVLLDLAARVTRGLAMPFEDRATLPAAGVVLLSAEDGAAETIRPRLEAAGADLGRVFLFDEVPENRGLDPRGRKTMRPTVFPEDVPLLAELLRRHGPKLVVIDPFVAFLGRKVSTNNDQSARRALLPLAKLAEASGAAVVVVRHLNKKEGAHALHRGGGSIGILGAARSGLLLAPDPDDAASRVLAVTKSNLAKPAPSVSLRLTNGSTGPRVDWLGLSEHTADTLLARKPREESTPALAEAMEFLRVFLANGPVLSGKLLEQARELNIAERTLRRAKQRLDVRSVFHPTADMSGVVWTWMLPPENAEG